MAPMPAAEVHGEDKKIVDGGAYAPVQQHPAELDPSGMGTPQHPVEMGSHPVAELDAAPRQNHAVFAG
jgi:hypothetical protein